MGIFDRDYDRDYGHRGGTYGNRDRDLGDRMRAGWNRLTNDDDRTYRTGYRTTAYDRDTAWGGGNRLEPENRDVYNRDRDWYAGRGMGATGDRNLYDRDYTYGAYGATGYDRNYKSRWETDYGDPFGDRTSRTPIRVMRGEFHNYDREYNPEWRSGYDRNYAYGAGSNMNYDREMMNRDRGYMHGVGYDPYAGGTTRGYRTYERGYDRDRGWF